MIDYQIEDLDIKSKLENLAEWWDMYTSYTKNEYEEVKKMLDRIYKIRLGAQDRYYNELVELDKEL